MKLYQRLACILILLFGALIGLLFISISIEQRQQFAQQTRNAVKESARIDAILDAESGRIQATVETQADSPSLAHILATSGKDSWWGEHFHDLEQRKGIDGAWLLDTNFSQRIATVLDATRSGLDVPFFAPSLRFALRSGSSGRTFAWRGHVLWDLYYETVIDDSAGGQLIGYLVLGRVWDESLVNHLEHLLRGEVQIEKVASSEARGGLPYFVDPTNGESRFTRLLGGTEGSPAARMTITVKGTGKESEAGEGIFGWRLLLTLIIGTAALITFYGWWGISRPVNRLAEAISRRDLRTVRVLGQRRGEIGKVARAALAEQRRRLESEERERDLLDSDAQIIERERFLSMILCQFGGVAAVLANDGKLRLVEGTQAEDYGLVKERDEGRLISSIFRGQPRLSFFESALSGHKISEEHKVGDRLFKTVCAPLMDEHGRVESVVILAVDLTRYRETERALVQARAEAERADRLKSQFLMLMSHETRTPLNGVLGYASVLRETDLDNEQAEYLARIMESAKSLLHLLTDILELTRLEAGEAVRRIEPVSLMAFAHQLSERYRIAARQKRIDFESSLDPALPDIDSDQEMLSRVLGCLLDNAIKFTEAGKVTFTAEWQGQEGDTGVFFTVSDTGHGISEEVAKCIFNPFQQGDSSLTRSHGGMGLGLAIAHRMALLLDGRLSFETQVGEGTTFTFFLPAEAGDGELPGFHG